MRDDFDPELESELDSEPEAEVEPELESLSESTTEQIDSINEEIEAKMIEDTSPLYPLVCGKCKELNLTEPIHLSSCRDCKEQYCIHNASAVDPSKCSTCLSRVQMVEQIITKKTEHYNEEKDKVFSKTQKARQISFSGEHWLFINRKIRTMSDDELLLGIEFHRAIYSAMLYERDQRRSEWFHRNQGKQFKISTSANAGAVTSETVVKKTRILKPKTEPSLGETLKKLLDAGFTNEQIMGMLGGK